MSIKHFSDFNPAGGGADDSAAFNAFNAWAVAQNQPVFLKFDAGSEFSHAVMGWSANIQDLVVIGCGVRLTNISTNLQERFPVYMAPSFDNDLAEYFNSVDRYLIENAESGEQVVTLKTASEDANINVGEYVAICSFDLQFAGQPPNYRYYDYAKVLSKSNGVITLDRQLLNSHRDNYPYKLGLTSDGRANVNLIESGARWDIRHQYNDIEFVDNPNFPESIHYTFLSGRHIEMRRVKCSSFNPTQLGHGRIIQCHQTGSGEIDKLTKTLEYIDTRIDGHIDSATSVDFLNFDNCDLRGLMNIGPKHLKARNTNFRSGLTLFSSFSDIESVEVEGGYCHNFTPITTSAASATTLNGTTISWSAPNLTISPIAAAAQFIAKCTPGKRIYVVEDHNGAARSRGVYGTVKSISQTTTDEAVINIAFNDVLSGSEKLMIFSEPALTKIKGVATQAGKVLDRNYFTLEKKYDSGDIEMSHNQDFESFNHAAFGRLARIEIDVIRAGASTLRINNSFPTFKSRLDREIDLSIPGKRIATQTSYSGWAASDTPPSSLSSGDIKDTFLSHYNISATAVASGDMPIFRIFMEFEA